MPHARKPLSTTRPPRSELSRRDDLCPEEIRSIRADVQLFLQIDKRKKSLEATRPRTASVTPTLNLVLTRARDTIRTLTTRLENNTGENGQIRMYALPTFILSLLMSHLPTPAGFLPPSFRQQTAWKKQPGSQKETRNINPYHWTPPCGSSTACFRLCALLSRRSKPFCIPFIGSLWSSSRKSSYKLTSRMLNISVTYLCAVPNMAPG